jgi:hypothetical protein
LFLPDFGQAFAIAGRVVASWDDRVHCLIKDHCLIRIHMGIIRMGMSDSAFADDQFPFELVRHVAASTGLPEATAARVVADIAAYFAESVEDFVRRRHGEMRALHWKNDEIWPRLAAELGTRRFGVRELSMRQLRRIVYG